MKRPAQPPVLSSNEILERPLAHMDTDQVCALFPRKCCTAPFWIVAPGGVPMFRGPFHHLNPDVAKTSQALTALGVRHAELIDARRDQTRRVWYAYEPLVVPTFNVREVSRVEKEDFAGGRRVRTVENGRVGLTSGLDAWRQNPQAFDLWMTNVGLRGLITFYLLQIKRPSLAQGIACRAWQDGVEGWFIEYDQRAAALFAETASISHLLFDPDPEHTPPDFCAWFETLVLCSVPETQALIKEMSAAIIGPAQPSEKRTLLRRATLLLRKMEDLACDQ